jgi:hypothetical protein
LRILFFSGDDELTLRILFFSGDDELTAFPISTTHQQSTTTTSSSCSRIQQKDEM